MKTSQITFTGIPPKYDRIDKFISRSGQPQKDDFAWLKSQGVTDVINFRRNKSAKLNFNERETVNSLGMKYHSIPSVSKSPNEENIFKFLNLTEKIKNRGGRIHIHCMEGVDRTGLYSFIYKEFNNIDSTKNNIVEWIRKGLHLERYPNLIAWALNFVKKNKM